MCDCRQDIENRLLGKFKEQKEGENHKVEMSGYAFIVNNDGSVTMKGCMQVEMTYLHTFKKGNKRVKKLTQNMLFNYCPFCGEKYPQTKSVKK